MSGGSFDYLCYADLDDLFNRLGQIEEMAEAIAAYPDGEAASIDTHEIVAFIHTARRRIEARRRRLEPVWKAVEWHHSGDYGPDAVDRGLKAYYEGADPA